MRSAVALRGCRLRHAAHPRLPSAGRLHRVRPRAHPPPPQLIELGAPGQGAAAPRGQSLLREQARCALLPAPSPRVILPCAPAEDASLPAFAPSLWETVSPQGNRLIGHRRPCTRWRLRAMRSEPTRPLPVRTAELHGGTGREGARSELARGAATGPGGRQPPAPALPTQLVAEGGGER